MGGALQPVSVMEPTQQHQDPVQPHCNIWKRPFPTVQHHSLSSFCSAGNPHAGTCVVPGGEKSMESILRFQPEDLR